MLYDRWRQVARNLATELALADHATNRRWTFAQLAEAAEHTVIPERPIACPQGNSPEFVLQLLAAWRTGQPVLPLEAGQSAPAISPKQFSTTESTRPGAPVVHFKLTSGTTGESQLIAFTAAQLAADADNVVATMGLRPEWPNLGVINLAHSYGFSNLVTPLLLHGVPLILHNIGAGAREEDILFAYPITGHYRIGTEAEAKLRALGG